MLVQHGSLVNAYFAWQEAYQLRATAKCHFQMASFSFDVFSGDLIRALCSGGKLVLCPRDRLLDAESLYRLMQQHRVDCAEFVPAVLRKPHPIHRKESAVPRLYANSHLWVR